MIAACEAVPSAGASAGSVGAPWAPPEPAGASGAPREAWRRRRQGLGVLASTDLATSSKDSHVFSHSRGDEQSQWVRAFIFLIVLFALVVTIVSLVFWLRPPPAPPERSSRDAKEDRSAGAAERRAGAPAEEGPAMGPRRSAAQFDALLAAADEEEEDSAGYSRRGTPTEVLQRTGSSGSDIYVGEGDVVTAVQVRTWLRLAKTTKLDIYTCCGLENGKEFMSGETVAFFPAMLLLIVMQALLPVLLIFVEIEAGFYPSEQDVLFRVIGFILYLYSVLVLYEGASDSCRELFLEMALVHDVSYSYILPMLFGDVMNTVTALLLTRTLYFIFVDSHRPLELLIKCIAINFVILIDNEWTSEHMRRQAIDNFKVFYKKMIEDEARHRSFKEQKGFKYGLQVACKYLCIFSRQIGVLLMGVICAFLFLFSNQESLCSRLGNDMWPVCISAAYMGGGALASEAHHGHH